VPEGAGSGTRGAWFPRGFWPSFAAPATLWLIVFFVVPFYVILAIAFGQLDQIFLTPIPVYNPLRWNANAFIDVVQQFHQRLRLIRARSHTRSTSGPRRCALPADRLPGRVFHRAARRGATRRSSSCCSSRPLISYMMRMLAWMNLLQPNGYVNRRLQALGLIDHRSSG
jgi:spermidine/putrescine transport system permease protein